MRTLEMSEGQEASLTALVAESSEGDAASAFPGVGVVGPADEGDCDDGDCANCGGEGVVYDCIDGCCVDAEAGCELCAYRCDWCRQ